MRFAPSDRQREIRQRFERLFTDELVPAIRRTGGRQVGGPLTEHDVRARRLMWEAMVDLGAVRLGLPAAHGGEDAGLSGAVVLAELAGAALYQSPLLDTLFAADLLRGAGPAGARGLDRIAEGATVAVAARDRGDRTLTEPAPMPADGTVEMTRRYVPFAADVDLLLVAGTTPNGLRCGLIPRDDAAVTVTRHEDIAEGDLYTVDFDPVVGATGDWIGTPGALADAWAAAVSAARIRHAAHLVGLAQGALDLTVSYARERRQFGQPIGRFQSLAFRLATAATDVEAARLLTHHAAWLADSGGDATMSGLEAVATAGDTARRVAAEAVQIHGAVGMTDDCDAQLFYRRAAIDAAFLGSPARHRREAARFLREQPSAPAVCLDRATA
ncbi:acyl-CoA dehydrogenase family protein [Actinoallomurus sp. NPDC052274]|uniref:acyl-CoA dehydrogenase family protein n=1 Tax=Actinoallomurus sp. NPDC052274 TaxID=3155420 RepID=UPI0034288065